MVMKKLSLIVPTYNAASYIGDALESIFLQGEPNLEVIVVDGLSTDSTVEIIRQSGWPISVIISELDTGAPDALNKGFAQATGDILCWLNADDVYINRETFRIVKNAFQLPHIQFAYGHSVSINSAGIITKTSFSWPMNLKEYQAGSNIFTGSIFFSRAAWQEFGGFSTTYKVVFEYELIDFLFKNYSFYFLDEHLAALRHYPGTLSDRMSDFIVEECIALRGCVRSRSFSYYCARVKNMAKSRVLLKALKNRLSDQHSGKSWRTVFNRIEYISE